MATRYWVGGAGTWNATTTTNWSATSGGAGGASAPTSTDDVIFDTLSNATAYAVTVGTNAVAQDITIAGPAVGNVTITLGATAVINCYSNWQNAATGVVFASTAGCALVLLSPTTGKTITTNGVNLNIISIITNQVNGGWTLGGALTFTGTLALQAGSFNTGNYSVTGGIVQTTGTIARSFTLGASAITLNNASPWNFVATTNLTFNAGTSTINCSNASTALTFAGGGLTYYDVNFTSTAGTALTFITGANTFNNLSQTSPSSSRRTLNVNSNLVILGTLTLGAANAPTARTQLLSATAGTPIVITVATIATLSDVDFRDVTAAGASAPWSGTRLGNGLGNTNITFSAGKTVYWNLVAGGNWSANAWALSSGGAVATTNFPLAQDTAIIDDLGLTTGNTITVDSAWWLSTLNCTRANAWTYSCSTNPNIFGDFTITSVTTVTGTFSIIFRGQGLTQTLTTNGVLITPGFSITSPNGTLLLNGAVTCPSTATVTLNNGTLNLSSYTLTTGLFSSSNTNVRALAFGAGNITTTGTAVVWNTGTSTNLTTTGTQVVNINNNSATTLTVSSGTLNEASAISFNFINGTYTANFLNTANYTAKNVNFTGFAGTLGVTATGAIIYGNLTLSAGMSLTASTGTLTFGATSGTKTITSNGKTIDTPVTFDGVGGTWQLQDAMTMGSTRTTALTSGILDLVSYTLTTGVFTSSTTTARTLAFGTGKIAVSGSGGIVVSNGTATNLVVTGNNFVELIYSGSVGTRTISGAQAASAIEGVNLFNYYITAGSDIVICNTGRSYGNIDFSNSGTGTFTGTFSNASAFLYGNLTFKSGMTVGSGANAVTFSATSGTKTITSSGQGLDFPITIDGVGGTFQLVDALNLVSASRTLTLTNGTFNANNYNVSLGTFDSSNANVRTLALGSGTWTVNGSGASAWNAATSTNLTVTGTSTINMSSASAKTFAGGGKTYYNLVQTGLGTLTISGSNTFNNISNTVQPTTVTFTSGETQTVSSFGLSGTAGNLVTLNSTTPGSQAVISKASGTVSVSYLSIQDSNATGGAVFQAFTSNGNVNAGNNTGWYFLNSVSFLPFF